MNVFMAERMKAFQKSVFSEMAQLKNAKITAGIEMIDLSVGSPDIPPPVFVMEKLAEAVQDPACYGYSLTGTQDFDKAVSLYYKKNFSINLDSENEILLMMGSQDGLVHLPMVLCNPGDYVLVPDPGYPAYATGVAMAGAQMFSMPLLKENGFLPDFEQIPSHVSKKAKLLILNFPGNPVPALATKEFFEKAIDFARQNQIVILHDFAYSELYYEEKPISFLSVEGAKDVGIEMNSLSKSFNMAGCRVAYAAGNQQVIGLLGQLKSNLDYGVFLPIQAAAATALLDHSTFLTENRNIYKRRRDILVTGLTKLGWEVDCPKASMFIWAKIPSGFTSKEFAAELINRANVVITPGNAFGTWGEGYVRIALVQPEEQLHKVLENLGKSGIFSTAFAQG